MLFMIMVIYASIRTIKKGKQVSLRPIPGLDALDEAVGRAAEMGRPVHYTPGYTLGGLYNPTMGPGVLAGITILRKVAESAAHRGVKTIVTLAQPEAVPIVEDILRTAYAAENQKVAPDAVRFISTEQYAYAAGVLSVLTEERPGASILMGYFWSESLQFAEGGSYIGAFQIGGTPSLSQIPFFIASCDYCLIGEEVFAARGYIDKDPPTLGTVMGQDYFRILVVILTLLLTLGSFGLTGIVQVLKI
jgi:hypothetical protein